ncbi:Profilin [Mycena indigotica]|uniref:Profilin n=1 Tax=Mycena indigotica TaxID=2126181 RepID=A0A8H6S3I2_9AGAR|nr:Profilin [Mycena indigotica]KAF7291371.1 Profilin [Mycena indigotica]
MSWQEYIDGNLIPSGSVMRAAIIGIQGGVWANSPDYTISSVDQNTIVRAFERPGTIPAMSFGGNKYRLIVQDATEMIGRRETDPTSGCFMYRTKQTVLVTEYDSPVMIHDTQKVVTRLGEYLVSAGY